VRATGLTTTALRAAHGARIAGENYRRVIKRLKDKIAKYEQLEASRRKRVEYLEDQIAEMLNDKATYDREMAKHGDK
jgi:Skp family chaperone for outer membrane proteins